MYKSHCSYTTHVRFLSNHSEHLSTDYRDTRYRLINRFLGGLLRAKSTNPIVAMPQEYVSCQTAKHTPAQNKTHVTDWQEVNRLESIRNIRQMIHGNVSTQTLKTSLVIATCYQNNYKPWVRRDLQIDHVWTQQTYDSLENRKCDSQMQFANDTFPFCCILASAASEHNKQTINRITNAIHKQNIYLLNIRKCGVSEHNKHMIDRKIANANYDTKLPMISHGIICTTSLQ